MARNLAARKPGYGPLQPPVPAPRPGTGGLGTDPLPPFARGGCPARPVATNVRPKISTAVRQVGAPHARRLRGARSRLRPRWPRHAAPNERSSTTGPAGSAGVEYRQTATQAGEIQQHRRRRTTSGDHPEPPSGPSKAVVKLDESATPARVDEAHVSEIDDQGGSTLALPSHSAARRSPMRLMPSSPPGAMTVGSPADNARGSSVAERVRRRGSSLVGTAVGILCQAVIQTPLRVRLLCR